MSPEAATVALVLIGSWALIAALSGGTELWQAWASYRGIRGGTSTRSAAVLGTASS